MKIYTWGRAALLLVALSCSASSLNAQTLKEGDWWAQMITPGGELADATYEVTHVGNSFRAKMVWPSGETSINDIRLKGKKLSFTWDPGFFMECRLERHASGQYKGACRDPKGSLGPIVLSPPDRQPVVGDFDPDIGFELWETSREEYMRAMYPDRQAKEERVSTPVPEPVILEGRSVEVDGSERYIVETGSGAVTIVLESGLGDDHHVWQEVQQALSDEARVISYDRAGLGLSDASKAPRTPAQIARELRALLEAASIPPPYVLVAHEAGALSARIFVSLYPGEVKGLVLVDPSHEELGSRWGKIDSVAWSEYVRKKQAFLASTSETAGREFQELARIYDQAYFEGGDDLPAIPVIVLSGLRPFETHRWIGETPEGLQAKKAVHATMAAQFGGDLMVTDESSSLIHLDQPELVVKAVRKVIASIEK